MAENLSSQTEKNFKSIEDILLFINPFGKFQRIINVILGIAYAGGLYQGVSACFTNIDPSWRCKANSSLCNYSTVNQISDGRVCKFPKSEWEYTQPVEHSIISQFDLICEHQWLAHISTSVYYIAWGISAMMIGKLSDYYGRKIMVIPLIAIQVVLTFASSFSPNVYMFIACRLALGLLAGGASPVLLVLMGELVDTRSRPLASSILCNLYSVGAVLLGVTAYFFREWKLLLIVYGTPYIILLTVYKFVPESIHWLYLHDRKDELNSVFKRMAHWNKVEIPENITASLSRPLESSAKCNFFDLFRPRMIAMWTVILVYGWFTVVMIYYGVSLAADDLGGSLYLNFILAHVIEIPANFFSSYTNKKFGRKQTVAVSCLVGSVACLAVSFIPNRGNTTVGRVVAGMIGKACITISYNSLYTWSIEIYPTSMRGYAVGLFGLIGRIGGSVSPWIIKGLKSVDVKAPFITIGALGVLAALSLAFLPETKGVAIKEFVDDDITDNVKTAQNDRL